MKTYQIIDPKRLGADGTSWTALLLELKADFLYVQPSGTTTLCLSKKSDTAKAEVVAVIPANLLVIEI